MMDYYSIRATSNSSLSKINPDEGGSPRQYLTFLERSGTLKNKYLERGTLIHRWVEDSSNFIIVPEDKPSDTVCKIIEKVAKLHPEVDQLRDSRLIYPILNASREIKYGGNWKDDTILSRVTVEGSSYFKYLKESDGKISVDKVTRQILLDAQFAIVNHKLAFDYLFFKNKFGSINYYSEIEIFWTMRGLECKAKLDRVIVDHDNKTITIVDLKTTSKSVYKIRDTIEKFRYYRQCAFYRQALIHHFNLKEGEWKIKSIIVAISTKNSEIVVVEMPRLWIKKGLEEICDLIDRIKYHQEQDKWEMSAEEYENKGYLKIEDP